MNHKAITVVFLTTAISASLVLAGIPEPDLVVYGTVTINGQPVTSADPVTIRARLGGDLLDEYAMGFTPAAGDSYVLRIPLENLADGAAPSGGKVVFDPGNPVPPVVDIYVQDDTGPEVLADQVAITDRGLIVNLNLEIGISLGDMNCDTYINEADIPLFVEALLDPDAYDLAHPDCDSSQADMDGSGTPDGKDAQGFVEALMGN